MNHKDRQKIFNMGMIIIAVFVAMAFITPMIMQIFL